jgi:PAS domain-containing protein
LKGIEDPGSGDWGPVAGGLFTRYTLALEQTGGILFSSAWTAVQMGFRQVMGTKFPHPEVATLGLPHGATESLVLLDPHTRKSTDELLTSPEWHAWGRILEAFKELCVENGIVPMLVYIPAATEVYAQYVLPQSGAHWLQLQNSLVATSAASEEAARRVAGKVGVEMVSLLPAYEEAARQGKMVYYAMDMHWNAEGRKIAAAFTAEAIRQRMSRPFPSTDASGLRAGQELSQLEKYSLMERTISGKIVSWNSLAEQLYGWTKEEAVGKISHELLNTRFSEPVDEINSELLENGRWEGKLDHLTRSGRRVEVKSEWVWDPKSRQSKIVEVNRPVAVADATIPDPRK